jgi:hypothetical protein
MRRKVVDQTQGDPALEAYVAGLSAEAARIRLPELFAGDVPGALYQVRNRSGVGVVAVRSADLSEAQIVKLLKYRLGQYVHSAVGMLNVRVLYEAGWAHEPLSEVQPNDLHFIAAIAETGEILCYAVLRSLPEVPPDSTLRTRERPLFQVEKTHGWGIYNRLRVLPDLPLTRVREMGRFIKNQQLHTFNEMGARGPVEIGVAVFRTLLGPVGVEVAAGIGDLEEDVAKQNLDFFHVPVVLIHGTVPYAAESSFAHHRYQYRTIYPFALLTADLQAARPRLDAIEAALEKPGKEGLLGLFALKREIRTSKSSLEPPEGLPPLSSTKIEQIESSMANRAELLDVGSSLRGMDLFADLSVAEAAILGSFMEERTVETGETIVHQGDPGEDVFLIEEGEAEVRIRNRAGESVTLATLGENEYFGEIALLMGGARTADVVAVTPMRLRRLTRDAYTRFLVHLSEVEQQITRAAAARASETVRKMMTE